VFVYGHYDVQPALEPGWKTNPWVATAIDGYLYGRGCTDDKGPILATLHALDHLRRKGTLNMNVTFVYEGEKECRSEGFRESIVKLLETDTRKGWLSNLALILVSNNYWIDETRPCLTYGMRGLVNLTISVSGPSHNLHSGVDGGALFEPMSDLIHVLSSLKDRGQVTIPGFYEDVEVQSEEGLASYDKIGVSVSDYCKRLGVSAVAATNSRDLLAQRWRNPTLSVVSVETSNSDCSFTVIPHSATAKVSVRYVPRQTPEAIIERVKQHINHEFGKLRSPNALDIQVNHRGEWWLGDPKDKTFQAAGKAVRDVWGQEPLLVREGGTMPLTSFLVNTLKAPALHLPLGQSSDSAHLANERISINYLRKGKLVIERLFLELGDEFK
jgi:acetylornithine deacetylase/succinyl-diaminopimelate desuccinylase-like protein